MGTIAAAMLAGLFLGVLHSAPGQGAGPQATLVKGMNEDGIAITEKLLAGTADGNVVFSPYSAVTAHLMLAYGCKGEDRAELLKGLNLAGLKNDEDILSSAELEEKLAAVSGNPFTFANAFVTIGGAKPVQSFLAEIRKHFGSEFFAVDAAGALDAINKWAAAKSKNRIPKLLDSLDIDNGLALMNAATYDGDWVSPFEPHHSFPGEAPNFTTGSGGKIVVDLMQREQTPTPYYAGNGFTAVSLAYKDNAYAMVVMLPDEGSSPAGVLEALAGAGWSKVLAGLQPELTHVAMPKFLIRSECQLTPILRSMGVNRIFDGFNARGMATWPARGPDQVLVDLQKAYIEVDEKGTKAAAVTIIGIRMGAIAARPQREFIANRPFVYAIVHKPTGTMTFLGVCSSPPKAKVKNN